MRLYTARFALFTRVIALGKSLGLALAFAASANAQSGATVYAWSAYPNAETKLIFTTGVAVDAADNVYASLISDHTLVRISPTGVVTTLAGSSGLKGSADGTGSEVRFNEPQGLAVDGFGAVYVADFGNSTIRKVSPAGFTLTLSGLAGVRGKTDGPPALGRFSSPRGVVLNDIGDLYVTDSANNAIRLITLDNHVQTIAGGTSGSRDGLGTLAQFMRPWGIARDQTGNLYVTDALAHTVRKLSAAGRLSTTIAGSPLVTGSADGPGAIARFNEPTGLAIDGGGNLFLTDSQSHTIRRIGADGQVTTIGGRADAPGAAVDGIGSDARFLAPYAVAVTSAGVIYVADYLGIRRGEPVRGPVITTQPKGLTARENTRVSLTVAATGAPAPTYQWRFNGVAVEGATEATLTFGPLRAEHGGDYTVVVTNAIGSVTSTVATLVVNYPPRISVAPQATLIGADGTAKLSVTATGPGPFTYQWLRNGDPIAGATQATLSTATYGNYSVAVTNAFGTSTTGAAQVKFSNRLVNLSTSGVVSPTATAIVAGFVVAAPAGVTKRLLIRAVGPSLRNFGVGDALPQTAVSLLDQRGALLARNSGWATNPLPIYSEIDFVGRMVGAFAMTPGSGDSALLVDVPRGNYTVSAEAAGGTTTGRSVVEVYEVEEDAGRLTNLSTRAQLGVGGGATVGFVALGATASRLLVRAIGPGLEQFGVTGAQQRPVLTLFQDGKDVIATNTGWSTATNAAQIEQAATAVGAFPLARGAADSAMLLTLAAGGNYTAEVSSANSTPGAVLIEIYQVP